MILKVISGGQTGADIGGLRAARKANLLTGGWAPRGYITERGPMPYLLGTVYGLLEHASSRYPPRTAANIMSAQLTIIVADKLDGGSALTRDMCFKMKKPVFHLSMSDLDTEGLERLKTVSSLWQWVEKRPHQIINIAGNRESKSHGIGVKTTSFLHQLFWAMK
jgi:hypothetical protein